MNVEEARRAMMRIEEDRAWQQLLQREGRDKGDVMRRIQRAAVEKERQKQRELGELMYDVNEGRAAQRELTEAELREKKRAEQAEIERTRRGALKLQRQRDQEKKREDAEREAQLQMKMLERERKLRAQREKERDVKFKTEHQAFQNRVAFANEKRGKANTPHPIPTTQAPTKGRTAETPSPTRRTLRSEDELQKLRKQEKEKERQVLELHRLQNLLRVQQKKEEQQAERLFKERSIEEQARRKQAIQDAQELEERRHHYEMLDKHSPPPKRFTPAPDRITTTSAVPMSLPPLHNNRSSTTEGDAAERLKEDREHQLRQFLEDEDRRKEELQQRRIAANLDREAREREQEAKAKEIAERKKHQELVREKNKRNVEQVRQKRKEAINKKDYAYEADLAQAKALQDKEREQQESFVQDLKKMERARQMMMEEDAAERHRQTVLRVANMKLENAELLKSISAASEAERNKSFEEAEILSRNKRKAVEQAQLRKHRELEQQNILALQERERRARAASEVDAGRREKIKEQEANRVKRKENLERHRQKEFDRKQRVIEDNAAFYDSGIKSKSKKPRVKPQKVGSNASTHVQMPPHPEMGADFHKHNELFLSELAMELDAADNAMKELGRV